MLMIGVQGQCPDEAATGKDGPWADGFEQPTVTEQRTHFGLWCTLSAPLTLSMDFQNKTATDSVWHIISNTHAIAVNQAWAGHPGTTFELSNSSTGTGMITLEGKEGTTTVPQQQAWYKPLPGGGAAIFVANHGNSPAAVTIAFDKVPGLGPPTPPAHCDASAFVDLGDTQCMGLKGPAVVAGGGQAIATAEACCAACSAAGATCDMWGFCGLDQPCASPPPKGTSKNGGTPGCFLGKSANCPNSTSGWVGQKR
eukprot:COSAG02_NODE_13967_length_1326_cov_1.049715_1_plen_253_part_10